MIGLGLGLEIGLGLGLRLGLGPCFSVKISNHVGELQSSRFH